MPATTALPRFALLALALCAAAPAAAQEWTGFYIGGYAGGVDEPDDGSDRFEFDTNLDGAFGDTVRTGAGADAFSPGFCNGQARGRTPGDGCDGNSDGGEAGLRAGFDWQLGDAWLFGVVGEYGISDARDAVSAFSTTPARYTYIRKVDTIAALRGRVGYIAGADRANLLYATAGVARAQLDAAFNSSNTANSFTRRGDESVDGTQWGVGYERRFGEGLLGAGAWTVGIEYLHTTLDDEDGRVRVGPGTAPATNPFLLVNPAGTDIRRSDDEFEFSSLRVFATYRF